MKRSKILRHKFISLFPSWHFVEYVLLRTMMELVNLLPITISTWLSRRMGDAMFLIVVSRRRVAISNLTIAFGDTKTDKEKRKIALESFRHLLTCYMELFRMPKFVKVSDKHVHLKNSEPIDNALARGKGIVLVMTHLGSWEYLSFIAKQKKCPATILGRIIKNPHIYKWVKSLRKIGGLEHRDKNMGIRWIFSELKKNHMVAIAIDQWAGNDGLWVDFFSVPTSTTSLPARMAERTGCALIPVYCLRVASGEYELYVEPEIPFNKDDDNCIENTTKELNRIMERKIRAFPEQWMWTHKRWKGKK